MLRYAVLIIPLIAQRKCSSAGHAHARGDGDTRSLIVRRRSMSALIGLWDSVYPSVPKLPSLRFFTDGWGDKERQDRGVAFFRKWVKESRYNDVRSVKLDASLTLDNTSANGSFQSPLASFLPAESQMASFRVILPSDCESPKAMVVLFPGIGDQTFVYRRVMLAQALLNAHIGVVLMVPPLYASRRPAGQTLHYAKTVELLLMQTTALQSEALVVLSWLQRTWPTALLGTAGLSWGGTNAACCGAMWDGPIAITAFISSAAFDPLLEGALGECHSPFLAYLGA